MWLRNLDHAYMSVRILPGDLTFSRGFDSELVLLNQSPIHFSFYFLLFVII